jgi:hypothetical protein
MVSDHQVLALWKEYSKSRVISISALKAGMSRKTASKFIKSDKLPSESNKDRHWKTHPDKLEAIWDEATDYLKESPELEAKALFEHLLEQHPDKLEPSQLRTFQRRVKKWRLQHGEDQEVYFDQFTTPGKLAQLDWVVMNSIGITVAGIEFKHKLIHFTLNHSNVESVSICRSESIVSIKKGIREFLYRVAGGAPEILQVDNSSAATHKPSKSKEGRIFNEEYLQILTYYGIKAQKTNISSPHENGVVESQNGHLKNKIKQALLIRGSSNFDTIKDYEQFLKNIIDKANKKRAKKFEEERSLLKSLPLKPLPEYQEEYVKIRNRSTVCIKKVTYSVPSRLIGSKLKAKIYEDKIELFTGITCVHQMPRVLGDRGTVINYRHIIHSLIKKPAAFDGYKYREELYPTSNFKLAYEWLIRNKSSRSATLEYLRILKLAADNFEEDVDIAIGLILEDKKVKISIDSITDIILKKNHKIQDSIELIPDLNIYDNLFLGDDNENQYH